MLPETLDISPGLSPQRMQLVTVGLLPKLCIPPPLPIAEFPLKVQLVTLGLLAKPLYIPPPLTVAEFPLKVQLVTVGLLLLLYIPPPFVAEFPLKVQLVTVGLLLVKVYIPPPVPLAVAEFPLKVQLVTVGLLLLWLYIPPPWWAEFTLKVQLVTAGLLLVKLYIPPPPPKSVVVFPLKVQLVTVGLLLKFAIPPPSSAEFLLKVQLVTMGLLPLSLYIPPGSHPRVPFHISTSWEGNIPYDGTFEEGIQAAINAANEWNDWENEYQNGGSESQLFYAGLTDVDEIADDGINAIFFKDEYGGFFPGGIYYHETNGVSHGFDVVLYSTAGVPEFPNYWSVKEFPEPWDLDVWTVIVHEFGHAVGLSHSFPGTVMGIDCGMGCLRRNLTFDDIDGILALYGPYTNEGIWSSTSIAAPSESFTLHLDYPDAANQKYAVLLSLEGMDGFPLRNWDSQDSRIIPLTGTCDACNNPFFPTQNHPGVFVDFGGIGIIQMESESQLFYAGLTDVDEIADDGINAIFFKDEYGGFFPGGIYYHETNGVSHGFDVVLYSTAGVPEFPNYWSVKEFPEPWDLDVWTVIVHEFGHAVGLSHSFPGTVMGIDCGMGCLRRNLTFDDIDGILALYGPYTNEGIWSSTSIAAPSESFTLHLDYPDAANQKYAVLLSLEGMDGFPLRNWDSQDSRIIPLTGTCDACNNPFFPTQNHPGVFVDFGGIGLPPFQWPNLQNGQVTATVNLPDDTSFLGTDLYFSAVTRNCQYVNCLEDVGVGVHVRIGMTGDLDGDGGVNAADLAMLLSSWGESESCPPFIPADLNGDCVVDAADLAMLLSNWGP